jgi:hypothetical protein
MVAVTQANDVPEAILALSTMAPPDYVDLFVASLREPIGATPEQFAREAIEGASALGRFLAWRAACSLRLEPAPSPGHIAGWKVDGRGEDWIRVLASSWFMTAHMVFVVAPSQASFATFIRYDRRIAAAIWGLVSFGHRSVAPAFLGSAVGRVQRRQGAPPRPGDSGERP